MPEIRTATPVDLPEIVKLQNEYVASGFVGLLRDQPYDLEERRQWFSQFSSAGPHQLLVAVEGDRLLGYCGSFAYRGGGVFHKTVEATIYASLQYPSKGVGTALYTALFERLRLQDLHLAVVGIALPNEASIRLHQKFGFEDVGVFKEYAYFKGQYVSSLWMQKSLRAK